LLLKSQVNKTAGEYGIDDGEALQITIALCAIAFGVFWLLMASSSGVPGFFAIFGPHYEALSAGVGNRVLVAGAAGSFSSLNPEQMSDQELRENNIIVMPIDQLQSRAKELNIPGKTVKELIDLGARRCYYTRAIPEFEKSVTIIDESSLNEE